MATKVTFKSTPCPRCNATGTVDIAAGAGWRSGTCFKCGGARRLLLPSGIKARDAYRAKQFELASALPSDLVPGDEFFDGTTWRRILEVHPGHGPHVVVITQGMSHGLLAAHPVLVRARLAAAAPALHAFARTLKGCTVTEA